MMLYISVLFLVCVLCFHSFETFICGGCFVVGGFDSKYFLCVIFHGRDFFVGEFIVTLQGLKMLLIYGSFGVR